MILIQEFENAVSRMSTIFIFSSLKLAYAYVQTFLHGCINFL